MAIIHQVTRTHGRDWQGMYDLTWSDWILSSEVFNLTTNTDVILGGTHLGNSSQVMNRSNSFHRWSHVGYIYNLEALISHQYREKNRRISVNTSAEAEGAEKENVGIYFIFDAYSHYYNYVIQYDSYIIYHYLSLSLIITFIICNYNIHTYIEQRIVNKAMRCAPEWLPSRCPNVGRTCQRSTTMCLWYIRFDIYVLIYTWKYKHIRVICLWMYCILYHLLWIVMIYDVHIEICIYHVYVYIWHV